MKLSPNKKPFRFSLGARGEAVACEFLKKQGYEILEKNYQCKLGEVDVIGKRAGRIAFVEIKTRSGELFGAPQEAVDARKREKILRIADWYLKKNKKTDIAVSFDVVAIVWKEAKSPEIRLIQDAFGKGDEVY